MLSGPPADSPPMTTGQLAVRALFVLFAALALLRLSGKRTFEGAPRSRG
jgi:hypothetical protein